jgi:hypothetical protein
MDIAALQARLQHAVGDEFTVGPLLGQGGFAAVFRCRDTSLNRDVAVKVLDVDLAPSPTLAERFVREAQTIARLEHPNIVTIHGVGKQGGVLFIVMRCVDGPSLRQLLAQHQRLSVADAARVARQVADALAYAHSQDIVHRDVKPDNILIDKKMGLVLVTDFGIAKAAHAAAASGAQLTVEGMIIGTPQYMSPEQAAGDTVDGRSDIYSLGIVLYHMLAGAAPFDGTSSAAILAKQLTTTPEPIRRLRADVSPDLAAVLDRMLEKDPAKRYQSAVEVSQALVGVLPTAARSRVKVKRSLISTTMKYLVGVGTVGCLVFLAFAAGAVAVTWFALSYPPRLAVGAPVPDSITSMLRSRGITKPADTVTYVFQPAGSDAPLLVLTNRGPIVATTAGIRRHPRDSVAGYDDDLHWEHGPHFVVYVKLRSGQRDTVYSDLTVRPYFALAKRLELVKIEDASAGGGVRVRTNDQPRR